MSPSDVTAVLAGVAGLIAAVTALVKVITTRPRLPVAEELLEQLDEMRDDLLAVARWAHRAVALAAAAGLELEEPPTVLRSAGHREGERRHDDDAHGWRSSVRVQTAPQRAVRPPPNGPTDTTMPDRRHRPNPPR